MVTNTHLVETTPETEEHECSFIHFWIKSERLLYITLITSLRWKYLRGREPTWYQNFCLGVMTREEKGKMGRVAQAGKAKAFVCLYGICWRLFIPIFIYSELRLQHCPDSYMPSVMSVQGIQTHFTAWLTNRLKQKGQNINCQHEVEATHKKISYCIFSASISFWKIA